MLDPDNSGSVFNVDRPASIPVLWALLDARPAQLGLQSGSRTGFGPRSPADDHVLGHQDLRSRPDGSAPDDDGERGALSVLGVLFAVADTVRRADVHGRDQPYPGSVADLCRWLGVRLDRFEASAVVQLSTLHRQLRARHGDGGGAPLGPCWVMVDDEGRADPAGRWTCGHPLYMPSLPPRAPDEPIRTLPSLRCPSCRFTYSGADLIALGRLREAAS